LCEAVPQVPAGGGTPSEETPRLGGGVPRGRVSATACNDLKSFRMDFTTDQCQKLAIPTPDVARPAVSDGRFNRPDESQTGKRPVSPAAGHPVVLRPPRRRRATPWRNVEDSSKNHDLRDGAQGGGPVNRVAVLSDNRDHHGCVPACPATRGRPQRGGKNDPLVARRPVSSVTKPISKRARPPAGTQGDNDQPYATIRGAVLPTGLDPHRDFAEAQARTDSGVLIRHLIFDHTPSRPFLPEDSQDDGSRQIVSAMKSVKAVGRRQVYLSSASSST
jgi:hypothetical protein